MEYGFFGVLILAANVYALIQVFSSGASAVAKIIWTLLILLLPVLGFIIWFFAGPRGTAVNA